MKQALVMFDKDLADNKLDAKFVCNVHDEWQVEALEAHAEQVGMLGVAAIIAAGKHLSLNCPLDGEYNVGRSWSETH
jgi:DNA polymerase I-like protein with 3'-5' exonuclease and polymerase domains